MSEAGPDRVLVFDAMCLVHFTLAERLDVLRDLLTGTTCLTTHVVREEVRAGCKRHPILEAVLDADWLGLAKLDSLHEIRCFAKWVRRVGSSERDLGEASVFSAAELAGGMAITDDQAAVAVGRAHGLEVHGTVWLLACAVRTGKLNEVAAGNIVDGLRETGMRLPCTGASFGGFVRRNGVG